MTKVLLPNNTHNHDMIILKEIPDHFARHTDPPIDHFMDVTLVTDIDHVHIQEITTILQGTRLPLDQDFHDQETLDLLDHGHISIPETNLKQYTHKLKMVQLTSKYYTCIIQLKWQML